MDKILQRETGEIQQGDYVLFIILAHFSRHQKL